MNKKAVEMNVNTIIIVILAILVLVILSLYFTGGMKTLWGKITPHVGEWDVTETTQARNACTIFCSARDSSSFCDYEAQISQKDSKGNVISTKPARCYEYPINAQDTNECRAVGFNASTCTQTQTSNK